MKQEIVVLLIACALAVAMVPKERRALHTEEEHGSTAAPDSSTKGKSSEICAPHTPCAWSVYKPVIKEIEIKIANSYCECGQGLACVVTEDDDIVSTYVYRCRSPGSESTSAPEKS